MLQKQPININFSQGLNTKVDPKQVTLGQFLSLSNSVFDNQGLLKKRNGFAPLNSLPDSSTKALTTFNGGLTAIGSTLESYSQSTDQWVSKGALQLVSLSTQPLVRSSTNQTYADAVVAPNGLVCTAYIDILPTGTTYKYTVSDSDTGQVIVAPTAITAASGTTNSSPRVFLLDSYFIIAFGTSSGHIQYIAITLSDPTVVTTAADITSGYISASTISWDGLVVGNALYVAYNSTSGSQSVKVTYLPGNLGSVITPYVYASEIATMMSLSADLSNPQNPIIYVSYYDSATPLARNFVMSTNLALVRAAVTMSTSSTIVNITSVAQAGLCTVFYEFSNAYSWTGASNFVSFRTINQAGTLGTLTAVKRSVGLASKAFIVNSIIYILTAYSSTYQPSYFLLDSTGNVISKLAYSNGGGYLTIGLPSALVIDDVVHIAYRIKDLIAATNKGTAVTGVTTSPVYSQTGINLGVFDLSIDSISSAEIGGTLNISGGILWSYDGGTPVEQGFNVWPDDINVTTTTGAGSIAASTYYYQVTYEWADNNGNVIRSAPSLPTVIVTTTASSTNTIKVPTLRLTYKANVKIVVYRWSTAQQVYYSITSPSATPTLNNQTVDSVTITDTLADASIIGNPILYTTGGVIENIGAPATNLVSLFNNRLVLIPAENPNLAWFSKQIIQNTPVEMSDLLTEYVAPTTGAQGSTGFTTSIAPMDDKLILFKRDAAYYISGSGPDNTGANNQYSDPIFISGVVGCSNQNSIALIPNGLMFQSDKGIWLLGRDLSTSYIGAPVEAYTQNALVKSALLIAGTNQVRFTMDSGITLMYDYFYQQWGSFTNIPAVSSTLYQSLHTYVDSSGMVFQESVGQYLDGSRPVLMSFTTGWGSLAGLQGYERFYFMYILGQYITPFKLQVGIAYDYDPNSKQSIIIEPDNYSPAWGVGSSWGSESLWGGPSQVFESRVFPKKQRCESFQITINEVYDPSFGVVAGAGLTLSGLTLIVGTKRGYRLAPASKSFG